MFQVVVVALNLKIENIENIGSADSVADRKSTKIIMSSCDDPFKGKS